VLYKNEACVVGMKRYTFIFNESGLVMQQNRRKLTVSDKISAENLHLV
jgi:hypothetical protein